MTRSWFEERQEAKKRKLRERAEKKEREAKAAQSAAEGIANTIPFGQPILVGHHSERRHRKNLERIEKGFQEAFEKREEAKELLRRSDAIGEGGISSDDPKPSRSSSGSGRHSSSAKGG